jgi:hypothetical protein
MKIYSSACSVVEREFDMSTRSIPRSDLYWGADKNEIWFGGREIRLTKWNPYAFAQGVVWVAFEDLMPSQQRLTITKRAVNLGRFNCEKLNALQNSWLGLPPSLSDC